MAANSSRQGDGPRSPIEGYRAPPGSADELLDAAGEVRPAWRGFLEHFGSLSPEAIARRFAQGDQHLRDAGVFYRHYDAAGSTERAWPFAHIPVLIGESEWKAIEAGLIQRADLLEAVAADLYGENRLVREGHLPASLIAASPEWLRPLVGVAPPSGRFLHFVAFEIGRGPEGGWWVLGDRTQGPSGAGFALENRVAAKRVFADFYAGAAVRPLTGFFRTFRDALEGLRTERDSSVAILTPGPLNDAYFEHAYLARHLGFSLVEGEDLAVEDGRVLVCTVSGLKPLGVIWRRIDASWADPLELEETSKLGAAGLVGAIRRGRLAMANALGAGVLETRALMAFLPRICEALRGEPLAMPNIATWWCGQPAERAHVEANAERMLIGPALSTALPFDSRDGTHMGADVGPRLDAEGALLVGQEAVTLSTTPAYVDGRLAPRPLSLRVFLARTGEGWTVMPGGYARIGRTEDSSAIAMQAGGSVADVWVLREPSARGKPAPVRAPAQPEPVEATRARPIRGPLPSRSADNLFWLGRYVERAEGMIRALRAHQLRRAEVEAVDAPLPLLLKSYLASLGAEPIGGFSPGLRRTLDAALAAGGRVRDRISVDGWLALKDLVGSAGEAAAFQQAAPEIEGLNVLLRRITAFAGLVHEAMYRHTDWRFLIVGRSLERALFLASSLVWFADEKAPAGALDAALELADAGIIHRQRYASAPTRTTVVELLVFDTLNPRSILFQLEEIRRQVAELPGAEDHGLIAPPLRAALLAQTSLAVSTPETLDTPALRLLEQELAMFSDLLGDAYLR